MKLLQDLYQKYKMGNIVVKLIFITVFFSFLLNVLDFIFFHQNRGVLYSFLSLSPSWSNFIVKPFSILTYAFVSSDLFVLLFNLLGLYYIGNFFLTFFKEKNFLSFFFLGIIGGGFIFLLLSLFFRNTISLTGFFPVSFCLLFAIIAYQPKINIQLFFLRISFQLQYVGYVLIAFQILMWLSKMDNFTPLVNLGTAALGFFYMKQFEMGNDFIGSFVENLFFRKKLSVSVFEKKPPRDDYQYQDQKVDRQKRLNEILEKISAGGYDALSKEEKEFLFKASKE